MSTKAKTLLLLAFSKLGFAFSQSDVKTYKVQYPTFRRTIARIDAQFGGNLSLLNNTITNNDNKVAWQTPSFLLPQFLVTGNVYNNFFPIDFGLVLPVRKNMVHNYSNPQKDTVVLNRYWQFSPGVYLKVKLGDYKITTQPYWIVFTEAVYNLNFGFKKKEMNYDYKGFDPFHNEFNILHGISNQFNLGPLTKKFNKSKDVLINKAGGPSLSIGIGRERSCYGEGWAWALVLTKNLFDIYEKNYTLSDNSKPFENWHQSNLFVEFKIIRKLRFSRLLQEGF